VACDLEFIGAMFNVSEKNLIHNGILESQQRAKRFQTNAWGIH
jgi:hypothetical protein